jgi:hypothetical protein
MPYKPGRPTKREAIKRLRVRKKAKCIVEVMNEQGKMNLTEARRRYLPNSSEKMHYKNAHQMLEEGVMDELEKILKVTDKDILKKLTPEVIVQDLLNDLRTLSELVKANKTDWEAVVKLLNAKAGKQKLIGMAIGIWKAEKPQEREKEADELFKILRTQKGEQN